MASDSIQLVVEDITERLESEGFELRDGIEIQTSPKRIARLYVHPDRREVCLWFDEKFVRAFVPIWASDPADFSRKLSQVHASDSKELVPAIAAHAGMQVYLDVTGIDKLERSNLVAEFNQIWKIFCQEGLGEEHLLQEP